MGKLLALISSYIVSGLIFRLLGSIGFGLATATFVQQVASSYLVKSVNQMNTALDADIAAYLNLLRADDCLSIMFGTISFVATYKSLKIIFIRA